MDGLPYLKFFAEKWLAGNIQAHDMQTQGIFINICARVWADGGEIEYMPDRLARIMHVDKQVLEDAIQLLMDDEMIIVTEGDNLSVKFIQQQLSDRKALSKTRSTSGRKGGKVKQLNRVSKCKASAKQNLAILEVEVEPEIEVESEVEIKQPEEDYFSSFENCWKEYPNKQGKVSARKAYLKMKPEQSIVIDGIKRYIKYVISQRAGGFPNLNFAHGGTWFHQQRWHDECSVESITATQPTERDPVDLDAMI